MKDNIIEKAKKEITFENVLATAMWFLQLSNQTRQKLVFQEN